MTVSQNIHDIGYENQYDDTFTLTDIPQGYFAAITEDNPPYDGSSTREFVVTLMPADWAQGGTDSVTSGVFVRQDGETAIKVTVKEEDGSVACENTTNY